MTCPHAATTTVRWIYGEADEAHLHHVAACAECQEVLAEHEAVSEALVPARRSVAWPFARPVAWGLALAAAVLLAFRALVPEPAPDPAPIFVDRLDAELDALDAELDALAADFDSL